MMTVSNLSKDSGVTGHAVRYYARIGLLKPERDPENGYRQFKRTDILRLRFIRQAQSLGFTLAEISEIFQESEQGNSPCPKVRDILRHRIDDNRRKLAELSRLQRHMEDALENWSALPDGAPDGYSVCHLIESDGADTVVETRASILGVAAFQPNNLLGHDDGIRTS